MVKTNRDSLGYLGLDFQLRLVAQLITDRKFSHSIMDIISPNYFEDQYLRIIVVTIKDAFEKHETIPDMGSLEFRLVEHAKDEIEKDYILSQLKRIKDADLNDTLYVQETAMKFCKQQEIKKAVVEINKIIERGDLDDYDKCEELLKKALEHGSIKDDGCNIFEDIEEVLLDDFRKPIPTGIKGLDEIMDGGLAKGEIGLILAAYGSGKTTMVTKIANTAKNLGYNVLQIFFEDNVKVIKQKHLSCWTGIELNNLKLHKEQILISAKEKNNEPGVLKLKKFPSDSTTIPNIKQYIRKQITQGFRPDIVLLDYIDCVQPSKSYDDVNVGEGSVMRQFETLADEFDFAGWTCVQGNRCLELNTLVDTPNGKIKISELKIGDEVLTHLGFKKIDHVFPIQKQRTYRIKTKSGKEILCSSKHMFPTNDGLLSISTGLTIGQKLLTFLK